MRGIVERAIDRFSRGSSHESIRNDLEVADYAAAEKVARTSKVLMYLTGSLALMSGSAVVLGLNDVFDKHQSTSSEIPELSADQKISLPERGMEVVQDVMMTIGAAALLSMSLEARKFSQIAQRRMTELERS